MNTPPLLAHLAARFVSQRENLATEALAYILLRSEAARSATIRTFRLLGADVPDHLTFRTRPQTQAMRFRTWLARMAIASNILS